MTWSSLVAIFLLALVATMMLGCNRADQVPDDSPLRDLVPEQRPATGPLGQTTVYWPSTHTAEQATKAFQELSTQHQQQLEPLNEILHDRKELMSQLPSLPPRQAIAVIEFLRTIDGRATDFYDSMPEDQMKELARQHDQGFMEPLERASPVGIARKEIESSNADDDSSLLAKLFGRKIVRLESQTGASWSENLNPLPSELLHPDSKNYIFWSLDEAKRFYSKTIYGGSLLVREYEVHEFGAYRSNLVIANNEAVVMPYCYYDNEWTTNLFAFDGHKKYSVYLQGRLAGQELDDFVGYMKWFIEYNVN